MNFKISLIVLLISTVISCEFNKSVNKDLITGLVTKGDELSCESVYLSDGLDKINRSSFVYGEKIYLNFNDIDGFTKDGDNAFPGLQLLVLGMNRDTVMYNNDLYKNNRDGFDISPLLLQSNITVAKPIHSGNEYTLFVSIWDKKGKGTYKAEMDFDVISNNQIKVENNSISYAEIYLFSQERNAVITGNEAKFDENIFMIFEGLEGFSIEDGKAAIGLSIKGKDSEGKVILNEDDLIGDLSIVASELKNRLAPNFIFSGSDIKNPVTCEVTIWDKRSDNRIKALIALNIK
ncbi:hypothetical protein FNH22_08025 [Fulvivirga sp. M361]|uniref:hypothetical protein n=1 Tax=Fulvivirga sp. M361 TaxID=2594266 RepID=UPI00117ACD31|nr:hypothetical protein [Fulvivirga sp. M361]TRX59992.1 hypothetical protein FNH22_08025 [Fulvivirga sp. M361]